MSTRLGVGHILAEGHDSATCRQCVEDAREKILAQHRALAAAVRYIEAAHRLAHTEDAPSRMFEDLVTCSAVAQEQLPALRAMLAELQRAFLAPMPERAS